MMRGTKEEAEKIIKLYEKGLPIVRIAESMNRSKNFVRKRLNEYKKDGTIYTGNNDTTKETEKIIEMYEKGYAIKEIASNTNRSYYFVCTKIENYRIDKCK